MFFFLHPHLSTAVLHSQIIGQAQCSQFLSYQILNPRELSLQIRVMGGRKEELSKQN